MKFDLRDTPPPGELEDFRRMVNSMIQQYAQAEARIREEFTIAAMASGACGFWEPSDWLSPGWFPAAPCPLPYKMLHGRQAPEKITPPREGAERQP